MHLADLFYTESPLTFIMPIPFFNVLNGGVHSGNQEEEEEEDLYGSFE